MHRIAITVALATVAAVCLTGCLPDPLVKRIAVSDSLHHRRPPKFAVHVAPATAKELGRSWHAGCPTSPVELRTLRLDFIGFDGQPHVGELIVNRNAVKPIESAMKTLYDERFPIRSMVPISAFQGSDNRSMAADNTSAFNCRFAKANGPKHWSEHAFGDAIDIDPRENPYAFDGRVLPPQGKRFLTTSGKPGEIRAGSSVVTAFDAVGWGWGGSWIQPDFQHFSINGH